MVCRKSITATSTPFSAPFPQQKRRRGYTSQHNDGGRRLLTDGLVKVESVLMKFVKGVKEGERRNHFRHHGVRTRKKFLFVELGIVPTYLNRFDGEENCGFVRPHWPRVTPEIFEDRSSNAVHGQTLISGTLRKQITCMPSKLYRYHGIVRGYWRTMDSSTVKMINERMMEPWCTESCSHRHSWPCSLSIYKCYLKQHEAK